jgi:hypothetical protein
VSLPAFCLADVVAHEATVNLLAHFIKYLGLQHDEVGPIFGIVPILGMLFGYFGYYVTRKWRLGREQGESTEKILEDGTKPFTGSILVDALLLIGLIAASVCAFLFWYSQT